MPSRKLDTQNAARTLESGGVLILPTDTLPGFHCRADCATAVRRIHAIKGRSPGKPLLILAADLGQARTLLRPLDARQRALAGRCWPGPFTLILPADEAVAASVTAGTGTLGVRVPDHPPLIDLIRRCGGPLVSTSCNRQGEDPQTEPASAFQDFAREVDGYWLPDAWATGTSQEAQPSALVLATVWPPRILREGPLPLPS